MADATLEHDAVQHGLPGAYEAPLFGAYSKKVGMWLFLASDSLTFGALLFAFSYNRIYTAWPTPFHVQSIINATDDDGVPAFEFADHGDGGVRGAARRPGLDPELAAGHYGVRHGVHRAARHGVEQTD